MESIETFEQGDKVRHPKFGQGTVTTVWGQGTGQKIMVKFSADVGEKKLVVQYAKLKKIAERPTLPPAEGGEGGAATAPADAEAAK